MVHSTAQHGNTGLDIKTFLESSLILSVFPELNSLIFSISLPTFVTFVPSLQLQLPSQLNAPYTFSHS